MREGCIEMKKFALIVVAVAILCGCSPKKTDKYFICCHREEDKKAGSYTYYTVVENRRYEMDCTLGKFLTLEEAAFFKARADSLESVRK